MRRCPYTRDECPYPHLSCGGCEFRVEAEWGLEEALEPRGLLPSVPDPFVYVRVGSPSGARGFGVEIGIRGTF